MPCRACLTLTTLLLLCSPAAAYEAFRTTEGALVHWESLLIGWALAGKPQEVSLADAREAARRGAAAWQQVGCHGLIIVELSPVGGAVHLVDGKNRIVWLQDGWIGTPAEIAVTAVTSRAADGRIVDADVLLNDGGYVFTVAEPAPAEALDLQGVLTHELGHLLGLAHTQAAGATMAADVNAENAHTLRSLEADDVVGLCSLYEPRPVAPGEDGASGPSPVPAGALAFAMAAGLVWGRRRRAAALLLAFSLQCGGDDGVGADMAVSDDGGLDSGALDSADLDLGPADGGDGDGGPGDGDGGADTGAPALLASLLAETPVWDVVSWETQELSDGIEAVTVELGPGMLSLAFGADGALYRLQGGAPAVPGCAVQGTWEAAESTLRWRWKTTPLFCPGEAPVQDDVLSATLAADGSLHLALEQARWLLGETGSSVRPYRVVLAPGNALLPPACPPLAPPAECTLTCELAGEGFGLVPEHTLGCAPPGDVKSCRVDAWDPETGRVAQTTCRRGCYGVTCTVVHGAAGASGGCAVQPEGPTFTYPPEDQP